MQKGIKILKSKKQIANPNGLWQLTNKGIDEAKRIVRAHNLWELYMENFMQIQPDHVHDSAESIEHILTPELEAELLKKMESKIGDIENLNKPTD